MDNSREIEALTLQLNSLVGNSPAIISMRKVLRKRISELRKEQKDA